MEIYTFPDFPELNKVFFEGASTKHFCMSAEICHHNCSVKVRGQGMVDGSASKPALRQDGYMVEKTYLDIAPYLGAFGAYLMPQ